MEFDNPTERVWCCVRRCVPHTHTHDWLIHRAILINCRLPKQQKMCFNFAWFRYQKVNQRNDEPVSQCCASSLRRNDHQCEQHQNHNNRIIYYQKVNKQKTTGQFESNAIPKNAFVDSRRLFSLPLSPSLSDFTSSFTRTRITVQTKVERDWTCRLSNETKS